jgi:PQQ-like domain
MAHRALVIAVFVVTVLSAGLAAQNWPQFRGFKSGVASDDAALPDRWSATENVAWRVDVPGRGWSSPVVWGDHVFVTSAVNTKGEEESLKPIPSYTPRSFGGPMSGRDLATSTDPHRWMLYDIDFDTGKVRWERAVATAVPAESKHQKNSYASETP